MGKYFHSETDIRSPWHQVLVAFWQRYPNPYSGHVLTEDVLYREVTPSNRLLSRRLLTKTNHLPGWAERVFPGHMARAVYVLEDSVVDPHMHTFTTKTWNLNHNTLMMVVERCVFKENIIQPSWTKLRREAWISSGIYGFARPIQRKIPHISVETRVSRQTSTRPSHHRASPPPPRNPNTLSEGHAKVVDSLCCYSRSPAFTDPRNREPQV
ncbi:PRELI domain-containing protein 1, mitochondrial-like isoform X1 [Channa argus]|uniref:PRELI domain-containing protein 1, mitochondrial-like isoform X1 n=1 Tax=Channa argus TaxID=215402 RepID=UPI003522D8F3